jgi:hypothetical protein
MQLPSSILFNRVVDPCLLSVGDFALVIDYSKIIGSTGSAVSQSALRKRRPVFVNLHHMMVYPQEFCRSQPSVLSLALQSVLYGTNPGLWEN